MNNPCTSVPSSLSHLCWTAGHCICAAAALRSLICVISVATTATSRSSSAATKACGAVRKLSQENPSRYRGELVLHAAVHVIVAREVARNPPPITPQSPSLEHGVPNTGDHPVGTSDFATPTAWDRVAFGQYSLQSVVSIVYSDTSVLFCSMYMIELRIRPLWA